MPYWHGRGLRCHRLPQLALALVQLQTPMKPYGNRKNHCWVHASLCAQAAHAAAAAPNTITQPRAACCGSPALSQPKARISCAAIWPSLLSHLAHDAAARAGGMRMNAASATHIGQHGASCVYWHMRNRHTKAHGTRPPPQRPRSPAVSAAPDAVAASLPLQHDEPGTWVPYAHTAGLRCLTTARPKLL